MMFDRGSCSRAVLLGFVLDLFQSSDLFFAFGKLSQTTVKVKLPLLDKDRSTHRYEPGA